MGRHVIGVDEDKRASGKALFVPIQPAAEQGTHTQIRAAIRRMRSTQRKPFIIPGHGGTPMLVRRRGKARSPLTVLAVLPKDVDIAPRLHALDIVDRAVQRDFPTIYERLLLRWAASQ